MLVPRNQTDLKSANYLDRGDTPYPERARWVFRNLVLMAPDIDMDVAHQRVNPVASDPDLQTVRLGEHTILELGDFKMTIYASPSDRALSASAILFRSRRAEVFDPESISPESAAFWKEVDVLDVIRVPEERTDTFGHSYFASNPAVSADLVSLIRYGRRPGEPGRPLKPIDPPLIWAIESQTQVAD